MGGILSKLVMGIVWILMRFYLKLMCVPDKLWYGENMMMMMIRQIKILVTFKLLHLL
jgi:hypothetical protein